MMDATHFLYRSYSFSQTIKIRGESTFTIKLSNMEEFSKISCIT